MDLDDLIVAAEPNPLLLRIDALCDARQWETLEDLAARCRAETERGKQLWPIAEHVEYRLALQAPGEFAGKVMTADAGRFALGPLTEVAASTHRYDEVAGWIKDPTVLGVFAAERVIRGEDLTDSARDALEVLELPGRLLDWEDYPLATYKSDAVEVQAPALVGSQDGGAARAGGRFQVDVPSPDVEEALLALVAEWVSSSNGQACVSTGNGDLSNWVSSLDGPRRLVETSFQEAATTMAWAAANGGAHGRRRGAASGRFGTWWALASVFDLEWPIDGRDLFDEASRSRWYWFPPVGATGWLLCLAVEKPDGGWFAIDAMDSE
ncbi:MAG: hypothetical protein ABR507_08140 [Actinomycetota bacterium]|nr:hypothetical protein [Actinomycetota bacterium]